MSKFGNGWIRDHRKVGWFTKKPCVIDGVTDEIIAVCETETNADLIVLSREMARRLYEANKGDV